MKKFLLTLLAFFMFSGVAFAQENQVGVGFIYNRSDAQVPTNAIGAQVVVIRNFEVGKVKLVAQNTFGGWTDQSYTVGAGRVFRNDLQLRYFLPNFTTDFMGSTAEVYISPMVTVENQRQSGNSKTSFNPAAGIGFKVGRTFTEYHYVVGTNEMISPQGHRVTVQNFSNFPGNDKYNLVTGFSAFTGRFDPFGSVGSGQPVYGAKFFVVFSVKGTPSVNVNFKR